MKIMSTNKLITNLVYSHKIATAYKFILVIISILLTQNHSTYAIGNNLCSKIYYKTQSYSDSVLSKKISLSLEAETSEKTIQSTLKTLWKLYVDKQIAIVEANNKNALASTREKAARLEQTYKKTSRSPRQHS